MAHSSAALPAESAMPCGSCRYVYQGIRKTHLKGPNMVLCFASINNGPETPPSWGDPSTKLKAQA